MHIFRSLCSMLEHLCLPLLLLWLYSTWAFLVYASSTYVCWYPSPLVVEPPEYTGRFRSCNRVLEREKIVCTTSTHSC